MVIRKIVPELNLWINKTLYNNDVNYTYVDYPSKVSEYWRCRDSVLEILFNETSDPSGNTYFNGYHFIYQYGTVNKNRIADVDPQLWPRIQIYKNSSRVYAAKDDKFLDVQNMYNENSEFSYDSSTSYPYPSGIQPTEYVTKYKSNIITSGSDELHQSLPDDEDSTQEDSSSKPSVIEKEENIFLLTDEELKMCEYLYLYRSEQFELIEPFEQDFYYTLKSPLSKWIYVYLQCYMFNIVNYQYLDYITKDEDGVLRCYAEKHFSDRIYEYIQKHHCSLWNNIVDLGTKDKRIFVNHTFNSLSLLYKRRLTKQNLELKNIVIEVPTNEQPYINKSFEFIYDGVKLKQGVDYKVTNISTLSNPQIVIELINDKIFIENNKYQMLWNYLNISSPYSNKGISDGK